MQKDLRVPYKFTEDVGRSVHDLSAERRTTTHACVRIPLWFKKCTANDSYEIDFSTLLQSSPLVAPLMGKYHLQCQLFFEPYSNLYGFLDNNTQQSTAELLTNNHHRYDVYAETFRRSIPSQIGLTAVESYQGSGVKSYTWTINKSDYPNGLTIEPGFVVGRHSLFEYLGLPAGSSYLSAYGQNLSGMQYQLSSMARKSPDQFGSDDHISDSGINDETWNSASLGNWPNSTVASDMYTSQIMFNPYLNLDRVLTYLDIMRTYYVNRQEQNAVYQIDASSSLGGQDTEATVSLDTLDDLFIKLRGYSSGQTFGGANDTPVHSSVQWLVNEYIPRAFQGYFGGLFNTMYEPDYFSNMLSSEVGKVYAKVSEGTVHELYFANKLQKYIDRLDISGGIFSNWIRTTRGGNVSKRLDVPEIVGSITHVIDPQNITSVSNTYVAGPDSSSGSSIGQLAGVVNKFDRMWKDNKDGVYSFDFHCPEDGYLMAIVSIVPCVDYTQGIDVDFMKSYFVDDYTPQFQRLGFMQYNPLEFNALPAMGVTAEDGTLKYRGLTFGTSDFNQASYITTYKDVQATPEFSNVVGKHPAWLEMMTDVDKAFGEFSDGGIYESWILRRQFRKVASDGYTLTDITRYQSPLDFQYPFVAQSQYDPNFFLQLGVNCRAVRPIIKSIMPSFG